MPANVYECMFLLDTNKVAGDVATATKQIHGILERNHAEVLVSRPWDERRLAYPINGHKKGLYYLTYFRTEAGNLINIERFGNTTAATIPLALQDAVDSGRLQKGNLVLLASVGAGFTVGSVLLRW